MPAFHHGITAQEKVEGILPMRNANISIVGLVTASSADDEIDDAMYPVDTPVLLTGITQANIDKAGATIGEILEGIRDIYNPTVVVLRLSDPTDVDSVDVLRQCSSRLGVTPRLLGAPGIDTPAMIRKLVSIAKNKLGMVYASPRDDAGNLITVKEDIVAYRDTFGDRELCIFENGWLNTKTVGIQEPVSDPETNPIPSHTPSIPEGLVFRIVPDSGSTVSMLVGLSDVNRGFELVDENDNIVNLNAFDVTEPTTFTLKGIYADKVALNNVSGSGSLDILSFHPTVPHQRFKALDLELSVPDTLPAHIKSLENAFWGSAKFNQNIGGWDTSNVTNFNWMFEDTRFNQNIGGWDTSNAESMDGVFKNNLLFNQDLSKWCVPKITSKPVDFDIGCVSWDEPRPVWGTCPRGEDAA